MKKIQILLCTVFLILGFVVSSDAQTRREPGLTADKKPAAPTPVPEPMSIALLGGGLVGLYGLKKKFGKD